MRKFIAALFFLVILFFIAWFLWSLMFKASAQKEQLGQQANLVQTEGGYVAQNDGSTRSVMSIDQAASDIKQVYKDDPEFQECAGDVVQSCLTRVISQKVRETGDLSLCDDFLTDDARESCRIAQSFEMARDKKDTSLCQSMPESQRQSCLREVATVTAIDSRDLRDCDILMQDKEQCVSRAAERIASETLDVSWCDNLDAGGRESCIRDTQERLDNQRQQEEVQVDDPVEQETPEDQAVPEEDTVSEGQEITEELIGTGVEEETVTQ